MLSTFTFVAELIVDEMEPIHALRVRATCRQASCTISSRTAAAIAFALTRKGTVRSETVGTWLSVWKACAEAAEAHGHDAGAWANSWHVFVAPPIWQSERQNELAISAFGVSEATLEDESMRRFMGFTERLVGREAQGGQQLTVVSILAMRLIIFPEEYHLSDDHGCGFQSSSVLLLSNGQFAVTRIWYSPYVMHFNHGDLRSSYKLTFNPGAVRSSCKLTNSLADLSLWTVDTAGRLLMTLPPTSDESVMPKDLKEELRHMFRQHRTHKESRLHNGTSAGPTCLRRCEEAKPSDAVNHKLAVQLRANRPKMLQRFPGTTTPRQRQQAVNKTEDYEGEDSVTQKMRHDQPAPQHHPIGASDVASLQGASFVEHSIQEGACADPHANSTISDEEAHVLNERVYLVRFKRRPKELHERLARSLSLQSCREALRINGFDWKLSSGPSVFVHPWQYVSVVQALPAYGLGNSDVVVTESLEYLLEESLSNAGKGVWAKKREMAPQTGACLSSCEESSGTGGAVEAVQRVAQEWCTDMEMTRTFLCVAAPRPNAASVIRSRTKSCMQPLASPRCVLERD